MIGFSGKLLAVHRPPFLSRGSSDVTCDKVSNGMAALVKKDVNLVRYLQYGVAAAELSCKLGQLGRADLLVQ